MARSKKYETDREEFFRIMAAEGMGRETAAYLIRAEAWLHRLAENACSVDLGDRIRHLIYPGEPRGQVTACGERLPVPWDKVKFKTTRHKSLVTCFSCKADVIEKRVTSMLSGSAFSVVFSGDPRGSSIKVKVPSGRTNDWGQEGICVP